MKPERCTLCGKDLVTYDLRRIRYDDELHKLFYKGDLNLTCPEFVKGNGHDDVSWPVEWKELNH